MKKDRSDDNRIKKPGLLFGIDDKYVTIIFLALFVILMIPIIYLGKYDFMKADDFSYGSEAHIKYVQTGSVFQAFLGALESVRVSYYTWQGTFSSIFLMSFYPSIFDYRFYKLVPILMVSIITITCLIVSYTLIFRLLGQKKKSMFLLTGIVLSILMIERMYSVPPAIYWYNAACHYVIAECAFFIMSCLYILISISESKIKNVVLLLISLVLAVETGGSNYATILMAGVSLTTLFVIILITKKKKVLWLIPSLIVFFVCLFINVTAPGNSLRGARFTGIGPIQSILMSFKSVFDFSLVWMDFYTVIVLIMLIPILYKCVSKTSFKFKYPYLVFAYSICVIATGFTSSYYALGDAGLSRTQNAIKMLWQVLLIFNEGYLIGFIRSKINSKKTSDTTVEKKMPLLIFLIGIILIMVQPAVFLNLGTIPSYTSLAYITGGHAESYWAVCMERLAILEDPSIEDAELRDFVSKPFYLYISDIRDSEDYWENEAMAKYFGKKTVVLKIEE